MRVFKFTLLSLYVFLFCSRTYAYDCEVDGIYYNRISATEAEVTYKAYNKDNNCYINDYIGNIIVPETITYNGKTLIVRAIGKYAFHYCENLTSIVLPNSITIIDDFAFAGCHNLSSITLSSNLVSLGEQSLFGVAIDSITFPEGFTTIGYYAIGTSQPLVVNFPKSIRKIGESAFVTTVKEVHFPDLNTLLNIDEGKKNVYGDGNCGYITIPVVDSSTRELHNTFDLYIDNKLLTDLIIPDTITKIRSWAFTGCKSLTSVIIPNSVDTIGVAAFMSCPNLREIKFPEGLKEIGSYSNTALKTVTIPNNVEWLWFFENCQELDTVIIGSGVNKIYGGCFKNSRPMKAVYCLASVPPKMDLYVKSNGTILDGYLSSFDDYQFTWTDLYVPKGCKEVYQNSLWGKFMSINEFDPSTLSVMNPRIKNEEMSRYSITGCKISNHVKGVNIIKMSDGTTKKIIEK